MARSPLARPVDLVTGRNEEHRPAMIPAAQITRRADADNVPAQTVERDYVLAHTVAAISASAEQGILVFKGGTALRLCHFDEYRYSADLDFSVVEATRPPILELASDPLFRCIRIWPSRPAEDRRSTFYFLCILHIYCLSVLYNLLFILFFSSGSKPDVECDVCMSYYVKAS